MTVRSIDYGPLSAPVQIEMLDDIAVFRPSGGALEQAIESVKSAIASARDRAVRKLLIVAVDLEGFEITRHRRAALHG